MQNKDCIISPNWVCYIKDLLYADTLLSPQDKTGARSHRRARTRARSHRPDLFGSRGDPVRLRMFWSRGRAEA